MGAAKQSCARRREQHRWHGFDKHSTLTAQVTGRSAWKLPLACWGEAKHLDSQRIEEAPNLLDLKQPWAQNKIFGGDPLEAALWQAGARSRRGHPGMNSAA